MHHRKIVGLFLHGEEQYGKAGVKSNRPERVGKVVPHPVLSGHAASFTPY